MKYDLNHLSMAVRLALAVGVFSVAGAIQAQDSTTTTDAAASSQAKPDQPSKDKAKTLQAVSVTGSLIRRVDSETASPVVTLDRANIEASGKLTLGDALQQLPSVQGNATNTQNNTNGGGVASPNLEGGDGAARISLRGLGEDRTLMLVDGQRLANQDLNMIPQSMIERVDVLAEGASTVYGSDAIGGVVNFILRKDFKGAELSINDGISSHGDGQRHGFDLTLGESGERGSIVVGLDYNKYDPVLATRRDFSAHQLYLSSGVITPSGSSNIPTGKIQVPALVSQLGCSSGYVTRAQGSGSSQGDYRCYRGASDTFNYNAYNYIETEQERTNAFALGTYKFTDDITGYANVFYDHTHSSGQDAPEGTSANSDGWYVLASNPNNPFGITFGTPPGGGTNSGYGFNTRLTGLGTRLHTFTTDNLQLNTGLRGNFGQSSWTWDASLNYGYSKRQQNDFNELNIDDLQTAINNGANIFDQSSPAVTSALRSAVDTPVYVKTDSQKQVQFQASGELWDLPAGPIMLSVGALYRHESMNYTVSDDAILDVDSLSCQLVQEACGGPGRGADSVKELYAESLIPLLSQQPWAESLNLDLGIRTSDYSTTAVDTNKKIALEWKPIADLLVRGTISQVFRAPNLDELYDGYNITNPNLNDPCTNLSSAQLAQHANACQYVSVGYTPQGQQIDGLTSGSKVLGGSLKPEQGKSVDIGLVYDPSWLPGVSTTLDFWHVYLTDTLTTLTAQTAVSSCFNNENSPYCSYIHRYDDSTQEAGQIDYVSTPAVNLGNLSTTGIDFTLNYQIPHFDLGNFDPGRFKVGLNTTYTSTYKNDATPGQASASTIDYAGTYSAQFGNIARWRGTLSLNWTKGNWSAQWQTRYVNKVTNLNADADIPNVNVSMASVLYHSIQVGYEVPAIHTRFDIGVDNLSNKIPPLSYQNATNYNVDTSTYDTLGRYFWARATIKF